MRIFISEMKHVGGNRLSASRTYALVAVIFLIDLILPAHNKMQLTKKQWSEDLHAAVKTLADYHPNLYYRNSSAEFQRNAATAEQMIRQSHSDEACFVAIRKLFASVNDGHTRLVTEALPGYNRIFPVRMYDFSDGIFITGIAENHSWYIGSKVLRIGRFPAGKALKEAGELAFADNEFGRKCQAPLLVINCNYAYGLGITATVDQLPLEVETADGRHATILLSPVTTTGLSKMTSTMDIGPEGIPFKSAFSGNGKELPHYLRHLDGNHNYWFEHDKENRILYMQFNSVVDQQDESFEQFYQKMFGYYDEHAGCIDKFVLDLRFNGGGNGMMVIPFMNEIIKREKINQTGSFFTLTGRRSFSAAVLFIAELMVHTHTLLVGEPAGAAQNMFSDIQGKGTLPNCGATLLLPTEFFNLAWPAGKNYTIPPHYPAPFSSSDFFSGKDPAYEAVKTNKVRALQTVFSEEGPVAALNYFNEINCDWALHADELSVLPAAFPATKYNFSENELNSIGYDYLNRGQMKEARATFKINTLLFPKSFNVWDSYAEWFMKNGDFTNAARYYDKSLQLNPQNTNARDKLRDLSPVFTNILDCTSFCVDNHGVVICGAIFGHHQSLHDGLVFVDETKKVE